MHVFLIILFSQFHQLVHLYYMYNKTFKIKMIFSFCKKKKQTCKTNLFLNIMVYNIHFLFYFQKDIFKYLLNLTKIIIIVSLNNIHIYTHFCVLGWYYTIFAVFEVKYDDLATREVQHSPSLRRGKYYTPRVAKSSI